MEQWEEGGEGVGEEEGRERGLRGKQEECAGGVWGKIQNSHLAAKTKQHTHTLTLPSLLLTTRRLGCCPEVAVHGTVPGDGGVFQDLTGYLPGQRTAVSDIGVGHKTSLVEDVSWSVVLHVHIYVCVRV